MKNLAIFGPKKNFTCWFEWEPFLETLQSKISILVLFLSRCPHILMLDIFPYTTVYQLSLVTKKPDFTLDSNIFWSSIVIFVSHLGLLWSKEEIGKGIGLKQCDVIRFVSMTSLCSIAAPDCCTSQSKGRYPACVWLQSKLLLLRYI